MTQFIKAMRQVFCSLLFIAMACQSFAVFGSNLKRIEPYKLQAADSNNLREAWKKALSAADSIKSFRIRIEISYEGKASINILEYSSSDSIRKIAGNEEIIWIGKDVYHKIGDGPWEKYPEKNNNASSTDLSAVALRHYINDIGKSGEAQFIGRETMNGIPALVYQDKKYSGTTKTWFNEADGLLLKNHMDNGLSSPAIFIDYTLYDYNADIKIEPPTEYISVTGPRALMVPVAPGAFAYKGGGIGSGGEMGLGPGRGFNTSGGAPSLGGGTRSNAPATSVDQKPVQLNFPLPNYTEEARKNNIQGIVRVKVLVGSDGGVKQVRVTSGLSDGLNEEAIRCAYAIRFKPAMKNGQPVFFWVGVDIEFNLR
ncbi:MAG TPA: energy transducer TonB [Blastocatellia bacterium]|nr:energy transducer TonB [Blastocatellia bacterium]